jgi:hypothetical protein
MMQINERAPPGDCLAQPPRLTRNNFGLPIFDGPLARRADKLVIHFATRRLALASQFLQPRPNGSEIVRSSHGFPPQFARLTPVDPSGSEAGDLKSEATRDL